VTDFELVALMGFGIEFFPNTCIYITFLDDLVQINLIDMFDTKYKQYKKEIFFGMGI
jgi:hypothetical protein